MSNETVLSLHLGSECKCPSKVVLLWDFVGSWEWHDTDTGFQQKIEISLQLFHFLEYVWTLHQQLTTQLLFHITMTWIWLAIVWSYFSCQSPGCFSFSQQKPIRWHYNCNAASIDLHNWLCQKHSLTAMCLTYDTWWLLKCQATVVLN